MPRVRAAPSVAAGAARESRTELSTSAEKDADTPSTAASSSRVPGQRAQRERKAPAIFSPPTTAARKRPTKKAAAAAPVPPPAAAAAKHDAHATPVISKQHASLIKASKSPSTNVAGEQQHQRQQEEQPLSDDTESATLESGTPEYKKLEGRIRGQVKRLRYHLAFLDAYEAEGWRRASREKLKPSQELATATSKILKDKRAVVNTLKELQRTNASDTQYPQLAAGGGDALLAPEDIYCSRCGSTDTDEDNDILICDSDGCQRAYHQKCQRPWLKTQDIPVGDELWYCEVCLAVFNSLKLINSAFGTTYDTVEELFPELDEDERRSASSGDEGGASSAADAGVEDEDEDDEDFVVDAKDGEDESDGGSDEQDSDSDAGEDGSQEGEEAVVEESDVSDQELKYLRKTDVIDTNSRSMRSNSKRSKPAAASESAASESSFLGQRAAKINAATGKVVFGVIVDELEGDDAKDDLQQWQVVYYNDTMELLSREQVLEAITCAKQHEHSHKGDAANDAASDSKLILQGKRKRTQVNYRELNDALFAGKADSDEEADTHEPHAESSVALVDEDDDEDYVPKPKKKSSSKAESTDSSEAPAEATGTRSRRERKSVDYNALNEGLLGY